MAKAKAHVIAMYLPQYYPIPENDNVWGEGNYVEPDTRWGNAYLDALHEVLFD